MYATPAPYSTTTILTQSSWENGDYTDNGYWSLGGGYAPTVSNTTKIDGNYSCYYDRGSDNTLYKNISIGENGRYARIYAYYENLTLADSQYINVIQMKTDAGFGGNIRIQANTTGIYFVLSDGYWGSYAWSIQAQIQTWYNLTLYQMSGGYCTYWINGTLRGNLSALPSGQNVTQIQLGYNAYSLDKAYYDAFQLSDTGNDFTEPSTSGGGSTFPTGKYLYANGTKIYMNGTEWKEKGVNVAGFYDTENGSWTDYEGNVFWTSFNLNAVQDELDKIVNMSANAIRMHTTAKWARDNTSGYWNNIKTVIEECAERNLWVQYDIYSANGSANQYCTYWEESGNNNVIDTQQDFINIWLMIAGNISSYENVYFDLYNEPSPVNNTDYFVTMNQTIAQLRANNFNNLVVVEYGAGVAYNFYAGYSGLDGCPWESWRMSWTWNSSYILTDTMNNLAFSTHLYRYQHFYNSSDDYQQTYTKFDMDYALNQTGVYNQTRPVVVGEVGHSLWYENQTQEAEWFNNTLTLLDEHGIGYTGWWFWFSLQFALFGESGSPSTGYPLTLGGQILQDHFKGTTYSTTYEMTVNVYSPTNQTYTGTNVSYVSVLLNWTYFGNDTFSNATLTVYQYPTIVYNGVYISTNVTMTQFTTNYTDLTLVINVVGTSGNSYMNNTIHFSISITTPTEETEPPPTTITSNNILLFILVLFLIIINITCILLKVFLLNIIVSLSSISIAFVMGSMLNSYPITGILVIDISLVIFVIFCAIGNLISTFIKMR